MRFVDQVKEIVFPRFSKLDFLNTSLLLLFLLGFSTAIQSFLLKDLFTRSLDAEGFFGAIISSGLVGFFVGLIIDAKIKQNKQIKFVCFWSILFALVGLAFGTFFPNIVFALSIYLFIALLVIAPLYFFAKGRLADSKNFGLMFALNTSFHFMFSLFAAILLFFRDKDSIGALFSFLVFMRLASGVQWSSDEFDPKVEEKAFHFYCKTSANVFQIIAAVLLFSIAFSYGKIVLDKSVLFLAMFCLSIAPIIQAFFSEKSPIILLARGIKLI